MAESLKVLGQISPAANTLTTLYTVPGSTQATISTIVACNQNGSNVRVRISVAVAGATDDAKQYIYYDTLITNRDSLLATIGMTLNAGDVVRVRADNTGVSFSIFGVEVS
jgi:hypothetical protein